MKIHLTALIVAVIVITGATIVGRVAKVLNVNSSLDNSENGTRAGTYNVNSKTINVDSIGNSSDHLFWFMQISDLHISIFYDKERVSDLEKFANETVPVISPSVVLASGDLTDAKRPDKLGSKQYIDEWIIYRDILKKSNVTRKTVWLDIRGNHDNFDVPMLGSDNNFYQKFSIQGQKHQRSYMHAVKKGYDTVSFIAVDACLLPGPRRPFNFIGVLTSKEMELLASFEEKSRQYNYTIWFGHYPTSCIISSNPGIRKLMGKGLAYVCGHLHTLGGFMHNLYTRQQTGSLELELGDWKDERIYRVAAIDHGLFSFVDIPINYWPIILITNPKDAMFVMPNNEPLYLIKKSTHIRVLVWSISRIIHVKVRIGGSGKWHTMTHVDGPLYVASWNPTKYLEGTHTIEVGAQDQLGRRDVISQSFRLDGHHVDFGFWPRVILMSNVSVVFQFLFGVSLFLFIIPLCLIRLVHSKVKAGQMFRPRMRVWLLRVWFRKFWIFSCLDRLFWPMVIYSLYLPIGPWFVGEVLDDHIGAVFAWGTVVHKSYLPGSFTFAYGFLQILVFQYPLLFISAHSVDVRFQEFYKNRKVSVFQLFWRHLSFSCLIIMQATNAYFFWLAYGSMALILGPFRTWAVILGVYVWYISSNVSKEDLRVVSDIWCPNRSEAFQTQTLACGSHSNIRPGCAASRNFKTRKQSNEQMNSAL